MSDDAPIDFNAPDLSWRDKLLLGPRYALRQAQLAGSALTTGAASLVLPPGGDDRPPWEDTLHRTDLLPGAVSGMYVLADAAHEIGKHIPVPFTGQMLFNPDSGSLPGADEARAAFDKSVENAKGIISPPDNMSPNENREYNILQGVGSAALPAPGVAAIANPVARGLGMTLYPGAAGKTGLAIAGGLSTALEGAQDALNPNRFADLSKSEIFDPQSTAAYVGGEITHNPAQQQPVATSPFTPYTPPQPAPSAPPNESVVDSPIVKNNDTPLTFYAAAGVAFGAALLTKNAGNIKRSLDVLVNGARELRGEEFNAAKYAADAGVPGVNLEKVAQETAVPGMTATNSFVKGVYNSDAARTAYINAIAPDKTSGEMLRTRGANLASEHASSNRTLSWAQTGYDERTGLRTEKLQSLIDQTDSLTPEQRKIFSDGSWAADELDNRFNKFTARVQAGDHPPPAALDQQGNLLPGKTQADVDAYDAWYAKNRKNYSNLNDQAVRDMVAAAQSDPEIAALMKRWQVYHDQVPDLAVARGIWSPSDAAAVRNAHKSFAPSSIDIEGRVANPFSPRDLTETGWTVPPMDVVDARKVHAFDYHRQMDISEFKRDFIDQTLGFYNREYYNAVQKLQGKTGKFSLDLVGPARLIEKVDNPSSFGDVVSFMRNGKQEHYRVYSPELRAALDFSPTAVTSLMNAGSAFRKQFQNFTTGPASIAAGNLFAVKNAVRMGQVASIDRPAGTSFGLIDKGLNMATGGRAGWRGDPTGIVGQGYGILADVTSRQMGKTARMLDATNDSTPNRFMRAWFGDPAVDAMQQRLQTAYENSAHFLAREMAGHAGGSYGYIGDTLKAHPGNVLSTRFQEGPVTGALNNIRIPFTDARVGNMAINAKNLINDLHNIVNESATSHYIRMNRGLVDSGKLTRDQLSLYSRELTGNMSQRGDYKAVQWFTRNVPYANAMIQDVGRLVQAYVQNPFAVTFGLTFSLGSLAMAQAWLARLAGQDHVNYHAYQLSTSQIPADVRFAIPGTAPGTGPQFSLPQRFRPFFPIFQQAAWDFFGLGAHMLDGDAEQHFHTTMSEFFNKHITWDTTNQVLTGLSQTLSPELPPAMNFISGLATGREIHPTLESMVEPSGRGIVDRMSQPATSGVVNAPGRGEDIDPTTGSMVKTTGEHLIKSFMGVTGEVIADMLDQFSATYKRTGDTHLAWDAALDKWKQDFVDNNTWGRGLLFNGEGKLSANTPMVHVAQNKLNAMRGMEHVLGDIQNQGTTRAGGLPLENIQQNKLPKDPQMAQLAIDTARAYRNIQQRYLSPAMDTMKGIKNLPTTGVSPDYVRTMQNQMMQRYQQQMAAVRDEINDFEFAMAQKYGVKRIPIEHVQWGGTMDQFR